MPREQQRGGIESAIERLSQGDDSAVNFLWHRMWKRLTIRSKHLIERNELTSVDEEDIAQTVFHDIISRIKENKIERPINRRHLWRLMELAAYHRTVDLFRKENSERRLTGDNMRDERLDEIATASSFVLSFDDEIEMLTSSGEEQMADILRMLVNGYRHDEIMDKLDMPRRTYFRRLNSIREFLAESAAR